MGKKSKRRKSERQERAREFKEYTSSDVKAKYNDSSVSASTSPDDSLSDFDTTKAKTTKAPQPPPNVPNDPNPPNDPTLANNQECCWTQCSRRRKIMVIAGGVIGVLVIIAIIILIIVLTGNKSGWRKGALDLHNEFRKKHGVQRLKLSDELNESAQKCADLLAERKAIKHICQQELHHKFGENLYSTNKGSEAENASVDATNAWYAEEPKHDYENNNFQSGSGHFTQVVWKDTKKLGIGYQQNDGFTVVVAHYDPPGNFDGEYEKNVPEPLETAGFNTTRKHA